jgi:UDP-N-acetylglucosamine--N-acetylmuramyl-(pentapeptide) pyrophosphoryl-undecaprenol N-acetylglucosamine transferase
VLAAGGTGGHLFPAQALAEELIRRGWRIVLATEERGALYAEKFPAEHRIALSAATFKTGDPIGAVAAGWNILRGTMQARTAFQVLDPAIVIGPAGGDLEQAPDHHPRAERGAGPGEPLPRRQGRRGRLRLPDP